MSRVKIKYVMAGGVFIKTILIVMIFVLLTAGSIQAYSTQFVAAKKNNF